MHRETTGVNFSYYDKKQTDSNRHRWVIDNNTQSASPVESQELRVVRAVDLNKFMSN